MPSQEAEFVVEAWRKNLILKDTLKGVLKLPISSLLDEQSHTGKIKIICLNYCWFLTIIKGWYPLAKPVKEKKEEGETKEEEEEEEEKEEKSKKSKKKSEVRYNNITLRFAYYNL